MSNLETTGSHSHDTRWQMKGRQVLPLESHLRNTTYLWETNRIGLFVTKRDIVALASMLLCGR